jgi:hypothetical protein
MIKCLGQFLYLTESADVSHARTVFAAAPGPGCTDEPVDGLGDPVRDEQRQSPR